MRVCLICVELFAWGKYGGFGRTTRLLGRELATRGIEVFAVVPRRPGQGKEEVLDGITVLGFAPFDHREAVRLYRRCNADIYHSQEASLGSYLAMRAAPGKKHLITFRDHKFLRDWYTELRNPSRSYLRTLMAWFYERNFLVSRAIRRADRLAVCAPHLAAPIVRRYRLATAPLLLPTPVAVPGQAPVKSPDPTVCFLARWDRRKRPEQFLALAQQFPQVRFIAAGGGQDRQWDASLRRRYGHLPNLQLPGFIDQFQSDRLAELLGESWVLVNTSLREGLPTSFLEAMALRCALLSRVNPDNVAARFGYHAGHDDFAAGLASLLEDDAWRSRGESGYRYVRDGFELEGVIQRHLDIYHKLLGQ